MVIESLKGIPWIEMVSIHKKITFLKKENLFLHLHFPFLPMILSITDTSESWDVFTLHLASIKATAVTSAVISSCCLSLSLLAYDEFH